MTDAAIRTTALRKTYPSGSGPVPAVDGLELAVQPGEFFGLLGPNGAGKSTTMGMLTTRIVPTSGSASVAGFDVAADPVAVRKRIGVVTQANTMDRAVNLLENLEFRGRFFGMSGKESRSRAMDLFEQFGLTDVATRLDDHVSGGQSKRAMVCRALMHRPDILFLDEPTAGIDPQARRKLWDLLRELNNAGQTILLTTHYLEEAEELCGRIAVIDHGKSLACDTVEGIKGTAGADSVTTVVFDGPAERAAETVGKLDGIRRVEVGEGGQELRVHAGARSDGLLGELIAVGLDHGLGVRNASSLPPSLETAFLNLTGREYRE